MHEHSIWINDILHCLMPCIKLQIQLTRDKNKYNERTFANIVISGETKHYQYRILLGCETDTIHERKKHPKWAAGHVTRNIAHQKLSNGSDRVTEWRIWTIELFFVCCRVNWILAWKNSAVKELWRVFVENDFLIKFVIRRDRKNSLHFACGFSWDFFDLHRKRKREQLCHF